MKLTRSKGRVVQAALMSWRQDGTLSASEGERLQSALEIVPFDWKRLAKYAMWASLGCMIVSVGALLADHILMELIRQFFNAPDLVKGVFFTLVAAGFYLWGARRREALPARIYTNEALLVLGVLANAAGIFYLALAFRVPDGLFRYVLLGSFFIYATIGAGLRSVLVWIFAIFALAGWFGAETGYAAGYGMYFLGMDQPLHFVGFGALLIAASFGWKLLPPRLAFLRHSTYVLGLLYFFVALWILSLGWNSPGGKGLWEIAFGGAAALSVAFSLVADDGVARGFGLTFFFLNLYTCFFEYCWGTWHNALFFAALGASLWALGSHAEKIWNLAEARSAAK